MAQKSLSKQKLLTDFIRIELYKERCRNETCQKYQCVDIGIGYHTFQEFLTQGHYDNHPAMKIISYCVEKGYIQLCPK